MHPIIWKIFLAFSLSLSKLLKTSDWRIFYSSVWMSPTQFCKSEICPGWDKFWVSVIDSPLAAPILTLKIYLPSSGNVFLFSAPILGWNPSCFYSKSRVKEFIWITSGKTVQRRPSVYGGVVSDPLYIYRLLKSMFERKSFRLNSWCVPLHKFWINVSAKDISSIWSFGEALKSIPVTAARNLSFVSGFWFIWTICISASMWTPLKVCSEPSFEWFIWWVPWWKWNYFGLKVID